MADSSKYVFDMIVVKILVPSGDPTQAKVECEYRNRSWTVPQDRINITEFPTEGGYEIIEPLDSLLQSLQNENFKMRVLDGKEELVELEFKLPEYLHESVATLNDGYYFARFLLKDEEEDVKPKPGNEEEETPPGCIEIMFKLTPYCNATSAPSFPDPKCPNLKELIKEEDVLFLVGKPNMLFPDPSQNPFFTDENAFGRLNLSTFKPYRGAQMTEIPDLPNASCSINCERFQKKQAKLQRPSMGASQMGRSTGTARITGNCLRLPLPNEDDANAEPDADKRSQKELENSDEEICCANEPKKRGYSIPVPSYELLKSLQSRCCPICSYDLKFFPALATCPRCSFKPEPDGVKEEPKPKKIKNKKPICFDEDEERKTLCGKDLPEVIKDTTCKCTCSPNKVCAYCRVRGVCKKTSKMKDFTKTSNVKDTVRSVLNYNDDEMEKAQEPRPYLATVFSELKDLYNMDGMQCEREKAGVDCKIEGSPSIKIKKDFTKKLERSTAYKDIKKIRDDIKKQMIFNQGKTPKQKQKQKQNRSKCQFTIRKSRTPKCGQCNPLGCLPCVKPFKNKCGNKYFDYCAIREAPIPRRDDHGLCVNSKRRVPCSMGWLWNVHKPHRGWKPGYIAKKVKNLMDYFLLDFPADTLVVSRYCQYRLPKKPKLEKVDQQITLEVEKKNKDYVITFRPLKDRECLKTAVDPFMPMKPIQIRVTEDPLGSRIRSVKQCMFVKGFRECFCKQPAVSCCCRTLAEKNFMLQELQQLCQKYKVENGWHSIVLDKEDCEDNINGGDGEGEDDEYCFGLTPPAGIIKYHNFDRPDYRQAMTQYNNSDYTPIPVMGEPTTKNKYEQIFQKTIKAALKAEKEKSKPKEKKSALENIEVDEKFMRTVESGKGGGAGGAGGAGGKDGANAPPPGSPEAKKAALIEKMTGNKKLAKLVSPDGKLNMDAYLKSHPIPNGAALAAERARRLQLLLEEIPMPFELYSHRDRAFNSSLPCHPCGPCYPYGPRNPGGPCGLC